MNLLVSHLRSNMKLAVIPAFTDNYICAKYHQDDTKVAIVDPVDDKVVTGLIEETGVGLSEILLSHHHPVQGGECFRSCQLVVSVLFSPDHATGHKESLVGDNLSRRIS